jgi:hypothetical protein
MIFSSWTHQGHIKDRKTPPDRSSGVGKSLIQFFLHLLLGDDSQDVQFKDPFNIYGLPFPVFIFCDFPGQKQLFQMSQ